MIDVKKVEDFEKLTTALNGISEAIENIPTPIGDELVFDNTEKKVGNWFGKDLYCRTFDLRNTSLNYHTWNEDILGTKNSGILIISFDGFLCSTIDSNYIPLNYYRASSNYVFTQCNSSNDDLNIYNDSTLQNNVNAGFITIWYIKESW